jgi:hypothetical protein
VARWRAGGSACQVLQAEEVYPALPEVPVASVLGVDDSLENSDLARGQFAEDFAARADDQAGAVLSGVGGVSRDDEPWFVAAWLIRWLRQTPAGTCGLAAWVW